MKKSLGKMKTDKSAMSILDTDVSDYIHSGNFKKVNFELYPKDRTVTIRISKQLVEALKQQAKTTGISYQKFMRQALGKVL